MTIVVSQDGLRAIASGLRDAGTQLDSMTTSGPTLFDAGMASSLMGSILATTADTAARLTYEAHHLGEVVDACAAAYAAGDDSAANRFATLEVALP